MKICRCGLSGLAVLLVAEMAWASPYATELVSYSDDLTGSGLYNDPSAVLGAPSTNFKNSGFSPATGRVKLVEPAWNVGLNDEKLITTLSNGSSIVVAFDHQVENDPNNPYGIDFLVFGNPFYVGSGFVSDNTNMGTYNLVGGGWFENVVVSVSQDGETWYTYTSAYGDNAFPTQAYQWDQELYDTTGNGWTDELMDFTKPVNPEYAELLNGGTLTAAEAIALYEGSGGGTGFDLDEFGLDWIQYIKVEGLPGYANGEIDAFADVAASPVPVPAAAWLLGAGIIGLCGVRRRR